MTVAEINQYLIKINEIQEKMNVTLFQKGNMALILRIVLWTFFVGLLFYQYINQKLSVGNSLFLAILLWLVFSFFSLFIFSCFTELKEMEKVQIVPIEFAFYFKSKREYTKDIHKELLEKFEKFEKLAEKPNTEFVEKILFVPFVMGFIATVYLFMGLFTSAFKIALIVGGTSTVIFFIFFGAFAFKVLYGAHKFEKFLLKHFSSEKVDFLLSGETFSFRKNKADKGE